MRKRMQHGRTEMHEYLKHRVQRFQGLCFCPYPKDYHAGYLFPIMSRIHSFALSERWSSAANTDAFCNETVENVHLAGIAEGLSEKPGLGSASGIAVSSLIDAVKGMKGSPAAMLISAVHESEARIQRKNENKAGGFRDATHLSAAVIEDNLDCTILDTGEGNVLVISPAAVFIPRDFPKSSPVDAGLFPPSAGKKPSGQMVSHSLGEPHILQRSDLIQVNIRDLSLLLSSSGLYSYVPKERIAEIVRKNGENVETSCQELVREAQRAGSERTITIVLLHGHLH